MKWLLQNRVMLIVAVLGLVFSHALLISLTRYNLQERKSVLQHHAEINAHLLQLEVDYLMVTLSGIQQIMDAAQELTTADFSTISSLMQDRYGPMVDLAVVSHSPDKAATVHYKSINWLSRYDPLALPPTDINQGIATSKPYALHLLENSNPRTGELILEYIAPIRPGWLDGQLITARNPQGIFLIVDVNLRVLLRAALTNVASASGLQNLLLKPSGSFDTARTYSLLETLGATEPDFQVQPELLNQEADWSAAQFTIDEQPWQVFMLFEEDFEQSRSWFAWVLYLGGLVLTFAISAYTYLVTNRSRVISQKVQQSTSDLIQSEARYKGIMESAVDGIILIDESGTILAANKSCEKMFGYPEKVLIGVNVNELMPEKYRSQHGLFVRQYVSSGEPRVIGLNREIVGKRFDGSIFHIALSVSEFVVDGHRNFAGILHDVSPLKKALDAQRLSEERFKQFFSASTEAILFHHKGIIIDVNPAVKTLFGYELEDLLGHYFAKIISPDSLETCVDCINGNDEVFHEITGKHKSGKKILVEFRNKNINEDGNQYGIVTLRDVSEHRAYRQALIESEERFRILSQAAQEAIIIIDNNGNVTFWNNAAENIFQYSESEILGKNLHDLLLPEQYLEQHRQAFKLFQRTGEGRALGKAFELSAKRKSGEEFPVEIALSAVKIQEKWHSLGLVRDITERKGVEQAMIAAKDIAEKANQAKTDFLSRISHELRTPLNAIIGFAQMYEYDEALSESSKTNAREIHKAGEHLLNLVGDVLDLSKIETGNLDFNIESVDLKTTLVDCISLIESQADAHKISINLDQKTCADLSVIADKTRLKQVILNLLSNAIKYNRPLGSVDVYCSKRSGDQIQITVSDTGVGISKDRLSSLFKPFSRLDAEFSDIEGTGIGLAICKNLIESMDGSINVESTPGKGSRFWITLHSSNSKKVDKSKLDNDEWLSEASENLTLRVLVAEDNATNRSLLSQQLKLLGYDYEIVQDGDIAYDHYLDTHFDLLLTDLNMPKLNGFDLTQKIRQQEKETDKHLPIVAITANAMTGDREKCLDAGMDDFLAKPISIQSLKDIIEKWLPKSILVSEQSESDSPFDASTMTEMVGSDIEIHCKLLDTFIETTPDILFDLNASIESRSASDVVAQAHKLKSSSRAIGAIKMGGLCAEMENEGRSENWPSIEQITIQLEQNFAEVAQAAKQYCKKKNNAPIAPKALANNLGILLVDDDPVMLEVLMLGLQRLGLQNIRCAESGEQALDIIDRPGQQIDIILCDLNMPEMDGIEFLRHVADRKYSGGIGLISGESQRILKTAEKLAVAHDLNILGSLEKPVVPAQLHQIINRVYDLVPAHQHHQSVSILVDELKRGIAQKEFVNFYQPKVDTKSREVVGLEALIRWQHPIKGLLSPDSFIAVAEENGLIAELTDLVMAQALHDNAKLKQAGFSLRVAINISIDLLENLQWPEQIITQASNAGVEPSDLILEITESRLMANIKASLEVLTRLSLKRISLSIDDFGTGYSSLEQLQRIPFSEMKIDRAFVTNATTDDSAMAILESSVELAHKLDLRLVAEGVESEADWNLVSGLGCHEVQGYWISKPLPAEKLMIWLEDWRHKHRE